LYSCQLPKDRVGGDEIKEKFKVEMASTCTDKKLIGGKSVSGSVLGDPKTGNFKGVGGGFMGPTAVRGKCVEKKGHRLTLACSIKFGGWDEGGGLNTIRSKEGGVFCE